ncbi:MAG: 1-acyl-sn-glycerol-3-phosphate acyltransferase [Lachnospiraceae bacterium]|nr:1-acyl-sn-glycerol-3-phosphate acyltransferase [Lachnospiraceae bacterium]
MIIGENKEQVIENIKTCAERGELNEKVEVDDPNISDARKQKLVKKYVKRAGKWRYKPNNYLARMLAWYITARENKDTEFVGLENLEKVSSGAVITCNHFNPLDNTAARSVAKKAGHKRLYIVCQDTNYAMKGMVGFFMHYADTIPITDDGAYMEHVFIRILNKRLSDGNFVLIYPEQEMWYNYRKPRPLKRGAYYYAARCNVPVVSCFVEIRDLPEQESEEFYRTKYVIHVLPPIYPDPDKTVRENSFDMMERDYQQKKAAYEEAYGEELTYEFRDEDIAGWIPKEQRQQMA